MKKETKAMAQYPLNDVVAKGIETLGYAAVRYTTPEMGGRECLAISTMGKGDTPGMVMGNLLEYVLCTTRNDNFARDNAEWAVLTMLKCMGTETTGDNAIIYFPGYRLAD